MSGYGSQKYCTLLLILCLFVGSYGNLTSESSGIDLHVRRKAIIGGADITAPHPSTHHTVSLSVKRPSANIFTGKYTHLSHFCGGTLIAPSVVLTAAHCVEDISEGGLFVRVGAVNLDLTMAQQPSEERFNVNSIVVYPHWDSEKVVHDLALLHLSGSSTKTVVKVMGIHNNEDIADGAWGWAAGWGAITSPDASYPSVLQGLWLNKVSHATCTAKYGTSGMDWAMCTSNVGDSSQAVDTCKGDSGGGLVLTRGTDTVQVGVVSWGPPTCGMTGYYGVWTKLSAYASWLKQQVPSLAAGTSALSGDPNSVDDTPSPTAIPDVGPSLVIRSFNEYSDAMARVEASSTEQRDPSGGGDSGSGGVLVVVFVACVAFVGLAVVANRKKIGARPARNGSGGVMDGAATVVGSGEERGVELGGGDVEYAAF